MIFKFTFLRYIALLLYPDTLLLYLFQASGTMKKEIIRRTFI